MGTIQFQRFRNIFHHILVNFEISFLAISNFVKEWKRWPPAGLGRESPGRVKVEDEILVRLGQVW